MSGMWLETRRVQATTRVMISRRLSARSYKPSTVTVLCNLQVFQTMLQTANIARELEGIQTDVLLQAFADRIVVLVTQLGKVGSLVSRTKTVLYAYFPSCAHRSRPPFHLPCLSYLPLLRIPSTPMSFPFPSHHPASSLHLYLEARHPTAYKLYILSMRHRSLPLCGQWRRPVCLKQTDAQ